MGARFVEFKLRAWFCASERHRRRYSGLERSAAHVCAWMCVGVCAERNARDNVP